MTTLCGDRHQDSAIARVRLARLLTAQGDFDAVIEEIQHAIEIQTAILGDDNQDDTASSFSILGSIYSMTSDFSGKVTTVLLLLTHSRQSSEGSAC